MVKKLVNLSTKLGDIFGFCNTSNWVFIKKYYLWISKLISRYYTGSCLPNYPNGIMFGEG
jgi:hypothetical protein